MDMANIIAVAILLVAVGGIVGVSVYRMAQSNTSITLDQFISMYGEQIVETLKDTIEILQINQSDFADKDSYEKAIISTTIEKLKENSAELGIDTSIIDLFDTDALTEIVYSVLEGNAVEIFSVLGAEVFASTPELYDNEVIIALSEA